jgi:glycosyltransferase involved in cell wall biosynthesis
MKVLFATHFFPPGAAGGTESYTLGLARQIMTKGHHAYVVCAENWGKGGTYQPRHRDAPYDGIPVRRLSWNWQLAPDPFVSLFDNGQVERHLEAYLRELSPDVMHITSCYSLGSGIIRAARRAGVPTVLTLTDFWFISPRQTLRRGDGTLCYGPTSADQCASCLASDSTVYRVLTRALPSDVVARGLVRVNHWPALARQRGLRGYVGDVDLRRRALRDVFDQVGIAIAPSQALKDVYVNNGFPTDRIRLSRYGLDLSWRVNVRARPISDKLSVGYIGQIEPMKGVDVLVQAFRCLPGRSVELRIFGDFYKNPTYARRLRALSSNDERIFFMGPFERPRLAEVLSQVDVVVVPSVWLENAPVVIAEAFAANRPVIATDLPGMSELVQHGVNGLLFPRGDVAALANALHRLVAEPQLRSQLVRGVRPPRSIEDEAAMLIDIYAGLTACSQGIHE